MITTLEKGIINKEYKIININPNCNIKKRLYDLGLIKDTKIIPLYKSPLNDPTAYLICGSVIAIRCDDAKNITICEVDTNGLN